MEYAHAVRLPTEPGAKINETASATIHSGAGSDEPRLNALVTAMGDTFENDGSTDASTRSRAGTVLPPTEPGCAPGEPDNRCARSPGKFPRGDRSNGDTVTESRSDSDSGTEETKANADAVRSGKSDEEGDR